MGLEPVRYFLSLTVLAVLIMCTEPSGAYPSSKNECSTRGGYINADGQFVIKPTFLFASGFSEGIAWTHSVANAKTSPRLSDAIDVTGKILFSQEAQGLESYHCGLAKIFQNQLYGFLDKAGRFVIPPKLFAAENFVDGRAEVCLEKWHQTTINTKGEVVEPAAKKIQPRLSAYGGAHYDDAKRLVFQPRPLADHDIDELSFSDGTAHVFFLRPLTNFFTPGLIDSSNHIVLELPTNIKSCGIFNEGLAPVGVEIEGLDEFHQGHARRLGFIDKTGAFVIPPIYDEPIDDWWTGHRINENYFRNGVALVKWHGDNCYINRSGTIIRRQRGGYCEGFHDGLAAVNFLVDKQGKEIDLFDNSHGYQNLYDYELETFHLLGTALSTVRIPRPIKFKLIESAEAPDSTVKIEFMDTGTVPKEILDKIAKTIQQVNLPVRGAFLDDRFSFTFVLTDGDLACNYGQYHGTVLPPPPLPVKAMPVSFATH